MAGWFGKRGEEKRTGAAAKQKSGANKSRAGKFGPVKKPRKGLPKVFVFAVLAGVAVLVAAELYVRSQRAGGIATPPLESVEAEIDPAAQKLREEFIREMAQYESEIEPAIAALHLQQWAAERGAELAEFKTRALEQFAASEYAAARESLRRARESAAAAAAEHARQLAELKRAAHAAFENDRAAEAGQAVRRALELNPDDAEMRALQPRVDALPQVLELLRRADAARAENRPEKEIPALEKIIEIDPARAEQAARLKALQAESAEARYAGALHRARLALDAGDLRAAQKQIDLAKRISPRGAEIAPLEKSLRRARAQREFETATAAGETAKRRDDWAAASAHFARALQLQPNHKTALENHLRANAILAAARQIRAHIAQPRRLESRAALDAVAAYSREVGPLAAASPGLQALHAELARMLALYETEVSVTVVSDGRTHIIVRGIGQVGKTARRAIQLRPGKRVFEGSRAGYKSKLVTLDIAPGAASAEVTVICDEKI